jgi:hypothetical protein
MSGGLHRGCLANSGSINAFERVIAEAHTKGPQFITRHGAESSHSFHHGLPCPSRPEIQSKILLGGPKVGSFEARRARDTGRKIRP